MKNKKEMIKSIEKKKSFLEWITFWGVLITFFLTPLLYFANRLGGAVSSKQFFFIGAVNVLLIAWVWLLIRDARYRFNIKQWYLFIPGFFFIVSAVVSTIWGIDPMTSIFSTIGRGIGLIFFVYLYLFSLVTTSLVQVQGIHFLNKIMHYGFLASVVIAFSTFFTNEAFDIGSTWLNNTVGGGLLGNSSLAGAYLVFGLFFGVITFITQKTIKQRIGTAIGLFITAFSPMFINIKGLFVTGITWHDALTNPLVIVGQARAATFAIIIGLFIALLVYVVITTKRNLLKYGALVLLGLGIVITGFIGVQIGVKDSVIQKSFIKNVGENRIDFWRAAGKGIAERPIIGWGLENYRIVQNKYFDPRLIGKEANYEVWNDKPHNIFLEVLVTQGIVGLIAYLGVLISIIVYVVVLMRRGKLGSVAGSLIIGMMIAYILQNQVVFDSISSTIMLWTLLGLITGLLVYSHGELNKTETEEYWYWIGGVLSIGCIMGWIFFAILPSQKMIEAKKVFDAPTVVRIRGYDKLFSGFAANYIYTDLGIISYTLAETYSNERQDIAKDQKYVDVALKEMGDYLTVINREKSFGQNDYRVRLSEVMFEEISLSLKKQYTQEEANKMIVDAENTVKLAPTNPLGYLVLGRTLTFVNRINDARSAIDKAIELNPKIPQAHDLKNSFERFYGTQQQQKEALENAQKYIPGYQLR